MLTLRWSEWSWTLSPRLVICCAYIPLFCSDFVFIPVIENQPTLLMDCVLLQGFSGGLICSPSESGFESPKKESQHTTLAALDFSIAPPEV